MTEILILTKEKLATVKRQFFGSLITELTAKEFRVTEVHQLHEAILLLEENVRIQALLLDWDDFSLAAIDALLQIIDGLPIFAIADRHSELDIKGSLKTKKIIKIKK
jgi:hypothetical protein